MTPGRGGRALTSRLGRRATVDLDHFAVRALVAGLGVAVVAGPLGCFIVWRRMAYFGDTMAHSALLGVALGFLLSIDLTLAILGVTVAIACLLLLLQRRRPWLTPDTLLGILSHASLSLGLVAIGAMAWLRVDLLGYLFGDVLAVSRADIAIIYVGGALALAGLAFFWRPLLAVTVHEDLARAEGVAAAPAQFAFMILVAMVIALAMKVVGILLITSLLIIPAAAARRYATTPEAMAALAAILACLAVVLGLGASLRFDTPSGPSIVLAAAGIFAVGLLPLSRWRALSASLFRNGNSS
ncbi:MAG: metal ABC transporter permease [Rhodospirillales bacterium]|nr:metal ABC transporter permease [Rhodospirillales bacterium]